MSLLLENELILTHIFLMWSSTNSKLEITRVGNDIALKMPRPE